MVDFTSWWIIVLICSTTFVFFMLVICVIYTCCKPTRSVPRVQNEHQTPSSIAGGVLVVCPQFNNGTSLPNYIPLEDQGGICIVDRDQEVYRYQGAMDYQIQGLMPGQKAVQWWLRNTKIAEQEVFLPPDPESVVSCAIRLPGFPCVFNVETADGQPVSNCAVAIAPPPMDPAVLASPTPMSQSVGDLDGIAVLMLPSFLSGCSATCIVTARGWTFQERISQLVPFGMYYIVVDVFSPTTTALPPVPLQNRRW
eukprot:CAMPEP_0184341138 /NCGR_PEP_ID=MMETSP1089-20130417/9770_1 /TAXON_ID=38269 ORGANISM="Gloeochaete wittrockiana, Strain SAG46.84" /NCGR_SAMPLE_ID=MMETSP1089 /ASSEMBLY_ACC=CAM_ASM_000445 /LENGTH=252 /DNA_ID=CAMNT_0026669277 /DNA_START=123 /DNA_END=878 /DNA_ORIENTATION=-